MIILQWVSILGFCFFGFCLLIMFLLPYAEQEMDRPLTEQEIATGLTGKRKKQAQTYLEKEDGPVTLRRLYDNQG